MTLSRNLSLFAESVDSSGQASLTTGVAGTLPAANGGTGVNNGSNTITLANTLTTAGNFPQTLTASAATNVTLPPGTSGNYVMSTATQMANNPVTGTPSSSNYLRGDGTWSTVANTAASYTRTTITATASQTVFTVAYTSPYLAVYLNGVLILPTTDYTATNGTSVTLVSGAAAGDILDFLAYATGTIIQLPIDLATSVTGTLPPSNGGTGTTGTPSNGQLLIGNGTTYSTASLTQGTGISVTNGSGSITLANTGVTSITGTASQVTASASTGGVTLSLPATINVNTSGSAASLSSTLAVSSGGSGQTTYTNGQLLIGNTTGNTLTKATLTQGSGISITNGAGSITIAATGGGTVTSVATGNGLTGGTITTSGTISLDFYTGSSSGNTSFPIGSYLFVVGSALYTLQTSYALYISGTTKYVTTSGTGLSGTWTCRGNDNYGQSAMFQRTA
jgi:trimeric autotransporter adhesin